MRHQEFADYYAERFAKLCLHEEVPRIRPSFSDQVDLSWPRQVLAALLAYSEDARFCVYDIGRYTGRLLGSRLKDRGILVNFLEGQIANPLGIFAMKRVTDSEYRVRVEENMFSYGLQNLGIKFDWFLAGVLGSLASEMVGTQMGAREVDCCANGATVCSFHVQPVSSEAWSVQVKDKSTNWEEAVKPIAREYLFRSQMLQGRAVIRPKLGDAVDVSLLRLLYGAIFTYSPEVRTLLYAIGKRSGSMFAESMPEPGKAAMLSGEMQMHDEEGGFTVERKREDTYHFHIPECPAHGEPNIGEAAGYLEAGFTAGVFEVLVGKPVGAREIMCPSKGDAECVFELKVLE